MENDTKQYIQLHLSLLKKAMKEEGLIFGIIVDKDDLNNSKLAFVDKNKYFTTGISDGISISITNLNDGLLN